MARRGALTTDALSELSRRAARTLAHSTFAALFDVLPPVDATNDESASAAAAAYAATMTSPTGGAKARVLVRVFLCVTMKLVCCAMLDMAYIHIFATVVFAKRASRGSSSIHAVSATGSELHCLSFFLKKINNIIQFFTPTITVVFVVVVCWHALFGRIRLATRARSTW